MINSEASESSTSIARASLRRNRRQLIRTELRAFDLVARVDDYVPVGVDLKRVHVERARRRPTDHFAEERELRTVAGAAEAAGRVQMLMRIRIPRHRAAQVRARVAERHHAV